MRAFAIDIGAADLYLSTAEYVGEHNVLEGESFSLTSIDVTLHTIYKVIDGVAVPQAITFPEPVNLPMELK